MENCFRKKITIGTTIKNWIFRLTHTILLLFGLLIGIVLNPTILYANKTTVGNFTIYHNSPLDKKILLRLGNATKIIKTSELYDNNLKLDICLNDDSYYPALLKKLRGQAFGWGFYNKVVLMGNANCKDNYVELKKYKWNLVQLLAHEETHCLQFQKFGFWKSNPIANYPNWKWEGYSEYVSRKNADQLDLSKSIAQKIQIKNFLKDSWAINFSDGTIAPRDYYNAWLLMKYCLDIKKMSYENLLKDTTTEQTTTSQMMDWFYKQRNLKQ